MSDTSYLKDLILLRNDPSKVPPIRERASRGEADAQYAMGLIYAEGRGVEIDLAQAQQGQAGLGIGDNGCQRLVEFVSEV